MPHCLVTPLCPRRQILMPQSLTPHCVVTPRLPVTPDFDATRLDDIFSRRSKMLPGTRCIFEGAYFVSGWNTLPEVSSFCFSVRVFLMGLACAHFVWLAVNSRECYRHSDDTWKFSCFEWKHDTWNTPKVLHLPRNSHGRQTVKRKSQWHSCKQRRTRRFAKSRALHGCCVCPRCSKMQPIQGACLCGRPLLSQKGWNVFSSPLFFLISVWLFSVYPPLFSKRVPFILPSLWSKPFLVVLALVSNLQNGTRPAGNVSSNCVFVFLWKGRTRPAHAMYPYTNSQKCSLKRRIATEFWRVGTFSTPDHRGHVH